MPLDFDTRVGAYGVLVEEGRILLAHWHASGHWTLPGGGLEPGEDPDRAARREFLEETGYEVEIAKLLGLASLHIEPEARVDGLPRWLHSLQIIYRVRRTGGTLRAEIEGSTDDARWFPLEDVGQLSRVPLVDRALALYGEPRGMT